MEYAYLGGGCFWCLEAIFQRISGVSEVAPGYAGGETENPTYEEVCSESTGHAEVVRIGYDPEQIAFGEILDVFWKAHDPTTLNRQGGDVGSRYRSIILCGSEEEKEEAEASRSRVAGDFDSPLVTEIVSLQTFHPAEPYHRDYYNNHANAPYCGFVIHPKLVQLGLE